MSSNYRPSIDYFGPPVFFRPVRYRSIDRIVNSVAETYAFQKKLHMLTNGPDNRYNLRREITNNASLIYLTNIPKSTYKGLEYKLLFDIPQPIIHNPTIFLTDNRLKTNLVESIDFKLKRTIQNIFKLTVGFDLPETILINVVNKKQLRQKHSVHSTDWSDGILGFAINRLHLNDVSEIFIRENELDQLLLTIGHEIGHCLTLSHEDNIMEEAKAFAFELAWMNTIHKFNILNLSNSMKIDLLNPAENGLHDKALNFVRFKLFDYPKPIDLFWKISNHEIIENP